MNDYARQRIASIEITNSIEAIKDKYGVELSIDTTVDSNYQIKAWKHKYGNRELSAFACRKNVGDALKEISNKLRNLK